MKAEITFLGGDEETPGNVKSVTWESGKEAITFKVDEPLVFDTDDAENGDLNKEIVKRAQGNRFFRVALVPNDTTVPDGRKTPVDPEPVTNIDHSKEAMQTDPLPTDKFKEDQAKAANKASTEARLASQKVAKGKS